MSTFGSFTTVRLGIYSAQKGLDVTGNNITNINTNGYTRQRLNQVSLIPSVTDRYASSYNTRIGQGAAGPRSGYFLPQGPVRCGGRQHQAGGTQRSGLHPG